MGKALSVSVIELTFNYKIRKGLLSGVFICLSTMIVLSIFGIEYGFIGFPISVFAIALVLNMIVTNSYKEIGRFEINDKGYLLSFIGNSSNRSFSMASEVHFFYGGYRGITYIPGFIFEGSVYTEGFKNSVTINEGGEQSNFRVLIVDRNEFDSIQNKINELQQTGAKIGFRKDFSGIKRIMHSISRRNLQ